MVIWRVTDGRRGHDNQSRGLVNAITRRASCTCHDVPAGRLSSTLLQLILNQYPPGRTLPAPALIIGAGHRTHLPLLCAQRVYGGRTVVIMKPDLPLSWFDVCLIPEHDNPSPAGNVIVTRGALTAITPGGVHDPRLGLIMVGGPSRHYGWDHVSMINQIDTVIKRTPEIQWTLTDSPRTPPEISAGLSRITGANTGFQSWRTSGPDWVTDHLQRAGQTWVSADSVSMIYESLTAGTATGVLSVPGRQQNKISRNIEKLAGCGLVVLFEDWISGTPLTPCKPAFDEADRCAVEIMSRFRPDSHA